MEVSYLSGKLDGRKTIEIIELLLRCKKNNDNAVIVINSETNHFPNLEAIYWTLVDTGVQLTTIGVGKVAEMAAMLFALGDERILLPKTEYKLYYPNQMFEKAKFTQYDYEKYLKRSKIMVEFSFNMFNKTKITREVFEEKCSKGSKWLLTPKELKEYEVITQIIKGGVIL